MDRFICIGEKIHVIAPSIRKALENKDPAPILDRARAQIAAGAHYIDANIGPAEKNGPELMEWIVEVLLGDNPTVPLALDTVNADAIAAGLKVHQRMYTGDPNLKPIINSTDGSDARLSKYMPLAAEYGADIIALCAKDGIPKDKEERIMICTEIIEKAIGYGVDPTQCLFDPLTVVVKGMADQNEGIFETIKEIADMGLKTTCGLSNSSNGCPKELRGLIEGVWVSMAIERGLTSAIVNPTDKLLMDIIKTAEVVTNKTIYCDSYIEL